MSKKILQICSLVLLTAMMGCGVGVDGSPDWESGGDLLKTVSATVMVPQTGSASISKGLGPSMDVSEVPAAGYLAVVENFSTGEVCGSQIVESDGTVYVSASETCIEETIDSDPTRTRLILKAVAPGGSESDDGDVEKLIEVAITSDEEIAVGSVGMDDTISLQMIRSQLGVDDSAADSSAATEMLRSNAFRPNCFNTFATGLVTDSVSSGDGVDGDLGSMRVAFKCVMGLGIKPTNFGYGSYSGIFRAMANGELPDSVMVAVAAAISSTSCGALIDGDKLKAANNIMSGIRQAAATQTEDATTCEKILTDSNERSARTELLQAFDTAKFVNFEPLSYESGEGAVIKRLMKTARTDGNWTLFETTRAKVTAGALQSMVSMSADESNATIALIRGADVVGISELRSLGATYAGYTTATGVDSSAREAMIRDPIMYASYIRGQYSSGVSTTDIKTNAVTISSTLQTNYDAIKACMDRYGGYNSSCFNGMAVGEISASTAFSVVSTSPASGATGVAINTAVTATFSKYLLSSSVTTSTFTVSPNVAGTVSLSDKIATFTPSSSLAFNTVYTVTLTTGIKDSSGTALASASLWSFTTGSEPDTTLPTVLSTSPANGATGGGITNVSATFSEALNVSTMTAETFTLTQGGSPVSGTVSLSGTTATFTPSTNLAYSTSYTATITTAVKDLSGNALAAVKTWPFTTRPAPGTLDASFGTSGKVTTAIGTGNDFINNLMILPDGKIVVAGSANSGNADWAIARYNANGTLDTTFGTNGTTITALTANSEFPFDMAKQADGKYILAGRATTASTNWDSAVARYNTDGTLDTSFGTGGKTVTAVSATSLDQSLSVAIQPDGKILAGGMTRTPSTGTSSLGVLLRYNPDGTLATTTITSTGSGQNTQINGLAIQSDGKILGTGISRSGTAVQCDFLLIRYNADGSLDTAFDSDGIVTTDINASTRDWASTILLQPDGKILVAGSSGGDSGWTVGDFTVIRYNADGSLDTTFGTNGVVVTNTASGRVDFIENMALQSDGKIVVAGYSLSSDFSEYDFIVARYNANGSLDTSFGTNGIINQTIGTGYESAFGVAIQSDGKIVVGGDARPIVGNDDFAIVRYWP